MRVILIILCLHLIGCAVPRAELKAPCDPIQCTNRTPVNSWYKERHGL